MKDTANAEAAGNFVEFLKTDEAMKVFESYGFKKENEWGEGCIHGLVTHTDIDEDSRPVNFNYVFLGFLLPGQW